jgi:hypothetical protein
MNRSMRWNRGLCWTLWLTGGGAIWFVLVLWLMSL